MTTKAIMKGLFGKKEFYSDTERSRVTNPLRRLQARGFVSCEIIYPTVTRTMFGYKYIRRAAPYAKQWALERFPADYIVRGSGVSPKKKSSPTSHATKTDMEMLYWRRQQHFGRFLDRHREQATVDE